MQPIKKADLPRIIVDYALDIASRQNWSDTSLEEIADQSGLTLEDLKKTYPSKNSIVAAYTTRIDECVLNSITSEYKFNSKCGRDRLLIVLIKRFEIMNTNKYAIKSIFRAYTSDVEALARGPLSLYRSMRWMLEAANISYTGGKGQVRIKGLSLIYLSVLRTWFKDDGDNMLDTIARLDSQLYRAERMLGFLRLNNNNSQSTDIINILQDSRDKMEHDSV